MGIIMEVVRITIVCAVFMSTCHAIDNINIGANKQVLENDILLDSIQEMKHKRDERSEAKKIPHQEPKVIPKVRPLNLRLDTFHKKPLNTVPILTKHIAQIPKPAKGHITLNNNRQSSKSKEIIKPAPKKVDKIKENPRYVTQKPVYNVKSIPQQFFEDPEELLPPYHKPEVQIPVKPNVKKQKHIVIADDKSIGDVDVKNDDDIQITSHETSPHANIPRTNIEETPINENENPIHMDYKTTDAETSFQNPVADNPSNVEGITTSKPVSAKNPMKNISQPDIAKILDEMPKNIEQAESDPNDGNIVISNHGFEEIRESSSGYIADTSNTNQEAINTTPNYSYTDPYSIFYNQYETCSINDPRNKLENYPSDIDASNFQIVDVRPETTDRVWRAWQNTEIRIEKAKINSIPCVDGSNIENKVDKNVIRMPYLYGYQPISNGYCGNQNSVSWPCVMTCPNRYV